MLSKNIVDPTAAGEAGHRRGRGHQGRGRAQGGREGREGSGARPRRPALRRRRPAKAAAPAAAAPARPAPRMRRRSHEDRRLRLPLRQQHRRHRGRGRRSPSGRSPSRTWCTPTTPCTRAPSPARPPSRTPSGTRSSTGWSWPPARRTCTRSPSAAASRSGGLNPYLFEMANIREHCSWIHTDMAVATEKAWDIIKMAVAKARQLEPLYSNEVEVNKDVLVIGGGVAGIQAALDLADAGLKVTIVEKETTIGGVMAKLDKTFPTIDCSACILTPRMVDCSQHENITLMAYCEVEKVAGYVGNFTVDIRKKASHGRLDQVHRLRDLRAEVPVAKRPICSTPGWSRPRPSTSPSRRRCPSGPPSRWTTAATSRPASARCASGSARPTPSTTSRRKRSSRSSSAPSSSPPAWTSSPGRQGYREYGAGKIKDVISGPAVRADAQRLRPLRAATCIASPTARIPRPWSSSSAWAPGTSRSTGPTAPSVCCMYTAKQALLTKDHCGMDTEVYVFYIDIRANGKGYEEFVKRVQTEFGVKYVRGRVSKLYEDGGKVMVRGTDTLLGEQVEMAADLVVLASGIEAAAGRQGTRAEAQHQLRRVRLHERRPSEAAPGGDQHRRRLPGRRLPGAQGHPGHGGAGLAARPPRSWACWPRTSSRPVR